MVVQFAKLSTPNKKLYCGAAALTCELPCMPTKNQLTHGLPCETVRPQAEKEAIRELPWLVWLLTPLVPFRHVLCFITTKLHRLDSLSGLHLIFTVVLCACSADAFGAIPPCFVLHHHKTSPSRLFKRSSSHLYRGSVCLFCVLSAPCCLSTPFHAIPPGLCSSSPLSVHRFDKCRRHLIITMALSCFTQGLT